MLKSGGNYMVNREELKIYLIQKKLTQSELAQELGVSRKTINNWILGKSKMRFSYENIIKLYNIFYQDDKDELKNN
jgi:transcriptional regulator with XRE-family HTH domain